MKKLNLRIWICLPALLFYFLDVLITLSLQPERYWKGNLEEAQEGNPLARILLVNSPWLFICLALVWAILFSIIILFWRNSATLIISFLITFGHALGAASWFLKWSWWGILGSLGFLFLAERTLINQVLAESWDY